MRRVYIFLIVLITAIAALIAVAAVAYVIFTSAQNSQNSFFGSMFNNMGGMMGGNPTTTSTNSLPYFGVLFAILVGVAVVGIVGLAYYLLFPQIRTGAASAAPPFQTVASQAAAGQQGPNSASAFESVSKTLTDEERRVIGVLQAHGGTYLQKYIRAETGLSRLKTHRIVARLADRGIVTLEQTGNTNQVTLANWLQTREKPA